MPKNIVICCDGTGNEVAGHPTNVLRLYHVLARDPNQVTYYDGGVGTLIDPMSLTTFQKWLRRTLDAAIGHSLRANFCKAYRFLASIYLPGDRIFLFGFSRGAYTARALAGAIYRFGVLRPELADLAEYAWSSFSDELRGLSEDERFAAARRFKNHFAVEDETRVWFVGAFDTVSSLGWFWDYRTLPNTAHNPAVDHIRHALAVDECRTCFGANRFRPKDPAQHQSLKEVWFPGVHSDVGGGYPDPESGLAKIALRWMLREAEGLGLRVDPSKKDEMLGATGKYSAPDPLAKLHNSMKGFWKLFELFPRRSWDGAAERMRWRRPNYWRGRSYGDKPYIHESVQSRARHDPQYGKVVLAAHGSVEL